MPTRGMLNSRINLHGCEQITTQFVVFLLVEQQSLFKHINAGISRASIFPVGRLQICVRRYKVAYVVAVVQVILVNPRADGNVNPSNQGDVVVTVRYSFISMRATLNREYVSRNPNKGKVELTYVRAPSRKLISIAGIMPVHLQVNLSVSMEKVEKEANGKTFHPWVHRALVKINCGNRRFLVHHYSCN